MNPLSAIFGGAVAVRNKLYDRGILKARKLKCPVVSAGNLSVGGSGKTPFVIALGGLLKERGIDFDVLSRGYKRRSNAVAIVDPEGSAEEYGDEPLLIARSLKVPVIVGADRYQAGLLAEEKFSSKLHLLDDGFQHRRLHRDFDIVLLPAADLEDCLLPVGRLREPLKSLLRADAVVMEPGTQAPREAAKVWRVRREIVIDTPAPVKRVVAFCGIARPGQFFTALRDMPVELAETVTFRDHHRYERADIGRLLKVKTRCRADGFVTTEKDMVKLEQFVADLQPIVPALLKLRFESAGEAVEELLRAVSLQPKAKP